MVVAVAALPAVVVTSAVIRLLYLKLRRLQSLPNRSGRLLGSNSPPRPAIRLKVHPLPRTKQPPTRHSRLKGWAFTVPVIFEPVLMVAVNLWLLVETAVLCLAVALAVFNFRQMMDPLVLRTNAVEANHPTVEHRRETLTATGANLITKRRARTSPRVSDSKTPGFSQATVHARL